MNDEICEFAPGDFLLKQGDVEDSAFILDSGSVKIVMKEEGHEQVLGVAVGGEVVGELALFEDAPRSANVVAVEHVRARKVSRARLAEWMRSDPAASMPFLKAIFERLRMGNAMLAAAQLTRELVQTTRIKLILKPISEEAKQLYGSAVVVEVDVVPQKGTAEIFTQGMSKHFKVSAEASLPEMQR